jgi:hypothetical protein
VTTTPPPAFPQPGPSPFPTVTPPPAKFPGATTPPPVGSFTSSSASGFTGSVSQLLEQEKLRREVENLIDDRKVKAATVELVARGAAVIPLLLEAMERRDPVLRRRAFEVLKFVAKTHGPLDYDPDAPDDVRLRQVAYLRAKLERRK